VPWLTETTRDCFDVTDVGTIGERDGRDDVPSLSGYNQSIFLYIYKIDISAFLLVVGSAPPLCRNTGATPVKTVLGRRLFLAVTWSTAGGFLVSLSTLRPRVTPRAAVARCSSGDGCRSDVFSAVVVSQHV
jgi:hypothetical protein